MFPGFHSLYKYRYRKKYVLTNLPQNRYAAVITSPRCFIFIALLTCSLMITFDKTNHGDGPVSIHKHTDPKSSQTCNICKHFDLLHLLPFLGSLSPEADESTAWSAYDISTRQYDVCFDPTYRLDSCFGCCLGRPGREFRIFLDAAIERMPRSPHHSTLNSKADKAP